MQNNLTRECKQTSLLKGAVCTSKMNRKYDEKNADRFFKNLQEPKERQLHELLQVCKNMICFLFQRIAVWKICKELHFAVLLCSDRKSSIKSNQEVVVLGTSQNRQHPACCQKHLDRV
jgi:hypothetical protein